jgi:hypothetical protein
MRFLPRLRSARLAAELAEVRDRAERAENEACCAAARIEEMFAYMAGQAQRAGLEGPQQAPRERHLSVVR